MKQKYLLFFLLLVGLSLQAETVVFLKADGTGDGSTPEKPMSSLNAAYKAIEEAGGKGTIVIVDKFTLAGNYARDVSKNDTITITSKYNGVDYRENNKNCVLTISKGVRWTLYRPTTFENITFSDGGVSTPYILFVSNFYPITMGEGIVVDGFPATEIATGLTILGGSQNGQTGAPAETDVDSHIDIKSGKFIVIGFNRQVDKTYTGTAYINISGGEIPVLYSGSLNAGIGGNLNMTISGGTFTGSMYACSEHSSRATKASGDALITITGGDFTKCDAIFANMDGESTVDLSGLADAGYVKRRLYYCNKLITSEGEESFLTPNDVFDYGSYTDSKGQMIPYRIYYPADYDDSKTYPLVLYMHGNGSRGSDNETHLRTGGSAFTSTLINSGRECIILAPQCPLDNSWVKIYPGDAAYTPQTVPMGSYLNAAKELLDSIMTKTSVDESRVYVFGVSNGGGATWDLTCRFPELFAAAIPMCGTGDSSGATAIGNLLANIPIWTFHGDADLTLSVEGTRGIVAAIEAAGGTNITYTEYPDVGHEAYFFSAHEGLIEWLFDQKKKPETVVFLKTGGDGDGSTPEKAMSSLNAAYKVIEDAGGSGTIVIVDKFTMTSASFARNVPSTENITITSKYKGVDYRDGNKNCAVVLTKGMRYVLFRPTTFENITFDADVVESPYILLIANYFPITMGEGIEVRNFPSTQIATSICILGGAQDAQTGTPTSTALDSHIDIKSGKFILVGFNRSIKSTYTGTANITISGGEILTLYGGSISGGTGGSLNLNISDGTFSGVIYAGNRPTVNQASGSSTTVISDGDFTNCPAIIGLMDGESVIDLSSISDIDFFKRRMYYFDKYITDEGEKPFLTPNEEFDFGIFTASSGTRLPYRIYFPENYDPSVAYSLVLDMHDNGSRGEDNILHLTTAGSAFVSTVLNSGNDCIILAPQCPAASSWVTIYPGNAGYTPEAVPMGTHLSAAKELLDSVLNNTNINRERIYIFGSSNGGGATWDLMCRFPDLFAAGVPMAGCGESSNAAAIGTLLKDIPIWTFHGDADLTLPVVGTRGIVEAIQAAGGTKIKYTEFAGIDHGVWWTASATEDLTEWLFAQKKTTSSIENTIFDEDVVAMEFYNLQGVRMKANADNYSRLQTGIYIEKQTLKSGAVKTKKLFVINK